MEARRLFLEIVTPQRELTHEEVDSVQLPSVNGYLGILPGHAPLLTELGEGELSYRKGPDTRYLTIFRGFAEVLPDRVILLAETAERAEEIDIERVKQSLERARQRLQDLKDPALDYERARAAFERALIRSKVAEKASSQLSAEAEERLSR
jgi:F-type H+-transporting ATPase subunit epsilon